MPVELKSPHADTLPFTLRGWHVLAMTLAFFAVIFAVNGVMIAQAIRTMPGADVKSAYEASQRFNAAIAEAHGIAGTGVQGVAHLTKDGATVEMRGTGGAPEADLALSVHLAHPADTARDIDLPLRETSPGHYVGATAIPPGSWHVSVEARRGGVLVFKAEDRLLIGERG